MSQYLLHRKQNPSALRRPISLSCFVNDRCLLWESRINA